MRKSAQNILTAASLLAVGAGLVWAAQPIETELQPRAYFAMGFGGPATKAHKSNFFYGLRIDRDALTNVHGLPPVVQLAFDRYGFTSGALNGMPFAFRAVTLQQAEAGNNFTVIDWTLLAVGAVGIGYTVAEVVNQKDSPSASSSSSSSSGGSTSSGGASGGFADGYGGSNPFEHDHDAPPDAIEEYQKWLDADTAAHKDEQKPQ